MNRLFFVILSGLFVACGGMQAVLRTGDADLVYREGLKYYEAEKWDKAATMFEAVVTYHNGTSREDSLAYMHARSKFKSGHYDTAAEEFDAFRRRYPRSVFLESAEGILAMCYYRLSPAPERDQTMTMRALTAIDEYTAHYPESVNVEEFHQMRVELEQRLYDKEWFNAYTYHKIGRHKSSIVALRSALKNSPKTHHRERIMYHIVTSTYELAEHSIEEKQRDRYLSMLDSYYSFTAEFPDSRHTRELNRLAENAKEFLDKEKNQ